MTTVWDIPGAAMGGVTLETMRLMNPDWINIVGQHAARNVTTATRVGAFYNPNDGTAFPIASGNAHASIVDVNGIPVPDYEHSGSYAGYALPASWLHGLDAVSAMVIWRVQAAGWVLGSQHYFFGGGDADVLGSPMFALDVSSSGIVRGTTRRLAADAANTIPFDAGADEGWKAVLYIANYAGGQTSIEDLYGSGVTEVGSIAGTAGPTNTDMDIFVAANRPAGNRAARGQIPRMTFIPGVPTAAEKWALRRIARNTINQLRAA